MFTEKPKPHHFGVLLVLCCLTCCCQPSSADDLFDSASSQFGIVAAVTDAAIKSPQATLGRELFWDKRISVGQKTSCGSCHLPADGGADRRRYSLRAKGNMSKRNSQTVFNATLQAELRWLADRPSAAAQASGSLTGSIGHDSKESAETRLRELGYDKRLEAVFGNSGQESLVEMFGKAVAAYEKTLNTPAPFDHYLSGDENAITAAQKRGLDLFLRTGCADCHSGALFGGEEIARFGVVKDYWESTRSEKIDEGLFAKSKDEEDKYRFRVPMLRNIASTGPYFHDGSVAKLERAVEVMAEVQLGTSLTADERDAIVEFLKSLTGQVPQHFAPPQTQQR